MKKAAKKTASRKAAAKRAAPARKKAVKPIPDNYRVVTPYLSIRGAAKAIEWYTRIFGAKERLRMPMGDKLGHAELKIGDSVVMLADEFPEMDFLGPQ
jgi:PhnB protein